MSDASSRRGRPDFWDLGGKQDLNRGVTAILSSRTRGSGHETTGFNLDGPSVGATSTRGPLMSYVYEPESTPGRATPEQRGAACQDWTFGRDTGRRALFAAMS